MQKLKLKFVLLSGIFLSSCGSLPAKPKIEICNHDKPNLQAECYDNQTGEYRSIPIESTNKYIMFSPDDWGLVLLYVDKLERRLRGKANKSKIDFLVANELKKILETSALLESQSIK